MLPSCRLNTSMSPTLYLRLSAARCACAAPMNDTGPLSPNTSAAPALPRTRSRREISNMPCLPCLPIGAPLTEDDVSMIYTGPTGLFPLQFILK